MVTNYVNQPWYPAGMPVDPRQGLFAEQGLLAAGYSQAVRHVISHFSRFQCPQVVARSDPLGELPEIITGQQVRQLGLADKNDLQQLRLGSLKVR